MDTRHRRFARMTEVGVLAAVRDLVAPGVDLDEFILENVRHPKTARNRTARIADDALPFAYPGARILDGNRP